MKLPFGKKPSQPVPRRRLNSERQARNDALEYTATRHQSSKSETISEQPTSFRRNQTLTGSRSTRVETATEYSRHSSLQSPRAQVHHLRHRRRKLGSWLAGGLVACAVVSGLLLQLTADVRVSLYGQIAPLSTEDQQRLETAVEGYLARYPLERLRFMLDSNRLVAYLASQNVREVERIAAVRSDGIGQTAFELVAREPIASWTIGSDRRYVDSQGVIFSHNYFDRPAVQIRDESGIAADDEDQATAVTSGRFLQFIGQAVASLTSYDIRVSTVSIPTNATRQVDMLVGKSRVKMTIDRPVGEQSQDAARAWEHLRKTNRSPRYIDVRVSGRAYYR